MSVVLSVNIGSATEEKRCGFKSQQKLSMAQKEFDVGDGRFSAEIFAVNVRARTQAFVDVR